MEPARSRFDADPELAIEMAADRAEPQVLTELLVDVRALLRVQEGRERAQQQPAYLRPYPYLKLIVLLYLSLNVK